MRAKDAAVREREIPVVVVSATGKPGAVDPPRPAPGSVKPVSVLAKKNRAKIMLFAEIDQSPLGMDWSSVYGQAKLYTENPCDSKGLDGSTVCGVGMTYAPLGSFICSRASATGLIFDPSAAIAGPIGTGGLRGAASKFEVTC